jgi:hypothetical protein
MRRAGRVDNTQKAAVDALRAIGASVQILSAVGQGVPDLLVGYHGVNVLVEMKTGNKPLTREEEEWHAKWAGQVLTAKTPEEAQIAVIKEAVRT